VAQEYGITPAGYRLPAATHPGIVRLQVADLSRSIDWYGDVLGLQAAPSGEGRALLTSAGDGTALVELHERRGAQPAGRRARLGLYHYALLLPDRASLGRLLRHLAARGIDAGAADHLVSEAIYLSDPDGLGIEVYADRPRRQWQTRGDELAMATDPLDAQSLLAAAGGTPWDGMPAGTRMGHIHLHVGDLPGAAAFYHDALGLDKVVWSYPGALFLSAGGYHHHLGVNSWAAGASPATADDARLLEWEIVVPGAEDVAAAAASMESAGYDVAHDGAGWSAADPWGTRLRMRAHR
jgi:catechol 2,3-dioxygenase